MGSRRILALVGAALAVVCIAAYLLIRTQAPSAASSDVIRVRIESFALNLTPAKLTDTESRRIASALHLGLVRVAQDGSVTPGVATKWEQADGRWRFVLASGASFTNGTPITAEAVVASLCASMQPASQWAWALASITQSRSADSKTVACSGLKASEGAVEITESAPAPWLLDALSGPAGWIVPVDATPEPYGVVPGAGPYKVERVQADREVVLAARDGGPLRPRAKQIRFVLVQDDAAVAKQFADGDIDVVEINTPTLLALMISTSGANLQLKSAGSLLMGATDRVRLLLLSEKGLAAKGMSTADIQRFKVDLHKSVDRAALARISGGLGEPLRAAVPLAGYEWNPATPPTAAGARPDLTIITEADPFSDLLAAEVSKAGPRIGVKLGYRGVDKGLLIKSLISGEYEVASIVLDATLHSPQYWKAFFTPGNPFTAFGKPLDAVVGLDVRDPAAVARLAETVSRDGNWIGLLVERKIVALAPKVGGLRLSPSGQVNYDDVAKQ